MTFFDKFFAKFDINFAKLCIIMFANFYFLVTLLFQIQMCGIGYTKYANAYTIAYTQCLYFGYTF